MRGLYVFVTILIFSLGCGRPYNSSFSDKIKYGSSVTGSANFIAARTVMVNKCFSCHGDFAAWNESEFVSNGRVVQNSLIDSTLYTRIRGNTTGLAGNMPPGENLSSEEITLFKTWIAAM